MPLPQKPRAAYVNNGWYLELPGLISPMFETFSGLKKGSNIVTIVDAGTNVAYHFASQLVDYGQIQLSRTMNGSTDDNVMDALVDQSIFNGLKFAGALVKKHFGKPVFSIGFEGLFFNDESWPEFNISGEDKLIKTYSAYVDRWFKIP